MNCAVPWERKNEIFSLFIAISAMLQAEAYADTNDCL